MKVLFSLKQCVCRLASQQASGVDQISIAKAVTFRHIPMFMGFTRTLADAARLAVPLHGLGA